MAQVLPKKTQSMPMAHQVDKGGVDTQEMMPWQRHKDKTSM